MSEITRREFLKAVIPGAWALELKKGQGIGGLSNPAKVGLLKDVVLLTGGVALLAQENTPKSFKEKVLSFDWERVTGKELKDFTSDVADGYLRLTKTNRVTKQDLMGTHFFKTTPEFINAVKAFEPDFTPESGVWGRTNFQNRQVFIDLAKLKEQTWAQVPKNVNPEKTAGNALLQALWHEWTRLDVTERQSGQFINNPQAFFDSPVSNKREVFRRYRGGAVFTDTFYGYTRFESVWNNTIVVRRMVAQVGLDFVFAAGDYYENGTDFFPLFTSITNIPIDTLYLMHTTSDFEGFMDLVGQKLPGNEQSLVKGERLFTAIHKSNRQLIEQTGVFTLLPKR